MWNPRRPRRGRQRRHYRGRLRAACRGVLGRIGDSAGVAGRAGQEKDDRKGGRGVAAVRDSEILKIHDVPSLDRANLVLAFTGWMNGGEVSTGTVQHLVNLLAGKPIAEIDPEPFCIYWPHRADGGCGDVSAARRDRRRARQEDRLADQHVLLLCVGRSLAVYRPGTAPAMANLWRMHLPTGADRTSVGWCSSDLLAVPCRTPACHVCTSVVPMPACCRTWSSMAFAARGIRARRVLNVFDDAGQDRRGGNGFLGGRDSRLPARRQPGEH